MDIFVGDGASVLISSNFSTRSGPVFLELNYCVGNEMDLLSCQRNEPLGLSQCPHSKDVGLLCSGNKKVKAVQLNNYLYSFFDDILPDVVILG